MKKVVVDTADLKQIAPFFRSRLGSWVMKIAISALSIDKVNALYGRCCHKRGYEFSIELLNDLNITIEITNPEMLEKLPEGAFITVSNHPFGALDGIALIALMGSLRPDYKLMVNSVLTYIEAMSPNFIAVEPYSSKKGSKVNLIGIKESIRHLREDHPLGFFPAGGVSKLQWNLRMEDNAWADNIIRLIRQANKPVIPVYFHGHNTLFFYLLGLVSWRVRTLRLIPEVFHARGKRLQISIGKPISVEEQQKCENIISMGRFLRQRTYLAGKLFR